MQYIIKNGKTGRIEHYCSKSKKLPENGVEVENWNGIAGEPNEYYDEAGMRYSEAELVAKGIIKDCRGKWWDIQTKQEFEISSLNMEPKEGWTDKQPLFLPYEVFENGEWVDDPSTKKAYEDSVAIGQAKEYLLSTDYKVIRALESGVTLDELYPGETAKREAAREVIRSLEV